MCNLPHVRRGAHAGVGKVARGGWRVAGGSWRLEYGWRVAGGVNGWGAVRRDEHRETEHGSCDGGVTAQDRRSTRWYTDQTMDDPPSANSTAHRPSPVTERGGTDV